MQIRLSDVQIAEFYHDDFVEDQTRDFVSLLGDADGAGGKDGVTIDVGGGCGFFARRLARLTGRRVRVLDMDAKSVDACRNNGVEAVQGDALDPVIAGDERIATFNLVLHHLVAGSERRTRMLQSRALSVWRSQVDHVFVNEYIYESYVRRLSGSLIFLITRSKLLSAVAGVIAKFVPALRANTFGVGVRFRSHDEWRELFESAGFSVEATVKGAPEHVALPLRLLLIKHIRRDSFRLMPRIL